MRASRRASSRLGMYVLGSWLVLSAAACGDPVAQPDAGTGRCTPGAMQACLCLGGAQGMQTCRDTGDSFSPCGGCGDLPDLPTAADLGGSACGDCDGCCDGTTCLPFASQTDGKCGVRNAACSACAAAEVCATGVGTCVAAGGCGTCAGGCCQNGHCLLNSPAACGSTCTKCTYGVTCAAGGCTGDLDPIAQFKIRAKFIELAPTNPTGGSWDLPGAGEADPKVCIAYQQGGVFFEGCSASCNDSLTCTFDDQNGVLKNGSGAPVLFPARILMEGKLRVTGADADLSYDDDAGQGYFPATTEYKPLYATGAFGKVVNITFELF